MYIFVVLCLIGSFRCCKTGSLRLSPRGPCAILGYSAVVVDLVNLNYSLKLFMLFLVFPHLRLNLADRAISSSAKYSSASFRRLLFHPLQIKTFPALVSCCFWCYSNCTVVVSCVAAIVNYNSMDFEQFQSIVSDLVNFQRLIVKIT